MGTVTPKPYGNFQTGEISGSATAKNLPDIVCEMVQFTAVESNAGNVYLGGTSGVTKVDTTQDATTGQELAPKAQTPWIPCKSVNQFWIICDNAGDDLTYLAVS